MKTVVAYHPAVCEACDGHGSIPVACAEVLDDRTGPTWHPCLRCAGSGIVSAPCPEPVAGRCHTYCYSG